MANQRPSGRHLKPSVGVENNREIIFPKSKASRNQGIKDAAGSPEVKGVRSREEALAAMSPGNRKIAEGKTAVRSANPMGQRNKGMSPQARAHGSTSRTKALYVNPNNPFR
jgi:hypothetical protein